MQESLRRPFGATLIALLLGWLAVAGFLNAFVWKAAVHAFNEPLPPKLSVFIGAAQSWFFTCIALAYGLTALFASIGIWRLRPWMAAAFLTWSLTVMVLLTWLLAVVPLDLPAGGKTVLGLWLAGTAAVLAVLYFYLRSILGGPRRAAL